MGDDKEDPGLLGGAPLDTLASLQAEEKAMRSGRGRMMAGMVGAVIAAAVALFFAMGGGGADDTYGKFGRNINGLRRTHFDAFWGCALSGAKASEIQDNARLSREIHKRATNGRSEYARTVREQCMPKLRGLEDEIKSLIPPEDMREDLRSLEDAVGGLRTAWTEYFAHLDQLGGDAYDEGVAAPIMQRIARAWFDYKKVHTDLNRAVRAKLEEQ